MVTKNNGHRAAVDKMVEALATRQEDAALVELCRGLADELDRADGFDDRLWREYRFALKALLERASGGSSDGIDDELQCLRSEMGDGTHRRASEPG